MELAPSQVGDVVASRYQIEEILGRGGMATVYRARDAKSGRHVALKRGFARDARKVARRAALLEREYHTLAQLAHPRIIEVYEYGVDTRGPYYTMQLLEGNDLDETGRMPWAEACAILYDIASSLAILHARGLLHRDVSLRNVRLTHDGRAKLIDFGAMVPFGVAKDIVGTPPFIAPEVLQLQELDARADLFSLGAIGYSLLTGRKAFPARRMSELRDVWRSRPSPPARLVHEVPAAVSDLVMQLLMLERGARPKSAAEVMVRLGGLAGLSLHEKVEVSRAYLTTPALVGRDKALVQARKQLLSLVRREGSTLLIEGVEGSGRSRMLDACVLEAKLLAVGVVRADAGDGAGEALSVARCLCEQLFELMPEEASAAAAADPVLAHVIESVRTEGWTPGPEPERSVLLRSLRDYVLALAQNQRLLIAVDDVDQIDEPSAALLAEVAHKAERSAVMLALGLERQIGLADSASLRLLSLVAHRIELTPLSTDETSTLIRSIFGDVPNVAYVAGHIHALAGGNPRATMDLARHLAERGLARYDAGSWLLPSRVGDGDLPSSIEHALETRVASLHDDARALAEVQAIAGHHALTIADYTELADLPEPKRVWSALDELVAARVFIEDGAAYRFAQRRLVHTVGRSMSDQRRRTIHARLADLLGRRGGDVLRRVDHMLEAGAGREAVELLCTVDLLAAVAPVPLLERTIERAEEIGIAAPRLFSLRVALLRKAALALAANSFRRTLPIVLAQLDRDSGLALYRELAGTPEPQRLQLALSRTQERWATTPECERVYSVTDAIRELARTAGAVCSFSTQLCELDLLESVPSLEPLTGLSPAIATTARVIELCKTWMHGRQQLHRTHSQEILERIAEPDGGGLDPEQNRRTRLGLHFSVALYEAALGISSASDRCAILEADREFRVSAWRLRVLLHLNQGNVDEARKCERRAELLHLKDSTEQNFVGMGAGSEASAYAETGDLLGVKSCLETLEKLSERFPGWRPMYAYGQCRYRWLQGDLDGALEVLLPAFEYTLPLRHNAYTWLAGAHVRLLGELGRIDEGVAQARRYTALFERENLVTSDNGMAIGVPLVLAAAGEHEEAVRRIDASIAEGVALGRAGLALGALHETRARVAITMRDRASFEHFAELCANEYRLSYNAGLGARFAKLFEDAERHGLGATPSLHDFSAPAPHGERVDAVIQQRLSECTGDRERGQCVLEILLQAASSDRGCLFGVRDDRAVLLAARPDDAVDPNLGAFVEECLTTQSAAVDESTVDDIEDASRTHTEAFARFVDAEGRQHEPIYLITPESESATLAAVLVLPLAAGAIAAPSRRLLEALARELVEHGDVTGLALGDTVTQG